MIATQLRPLILMLICPTIGLAADAVPAKSPLATPLSSYRSERDVAPAGLSTDRSWNGWLAALTPEEKERMRDQIRSESGQGSADTHETSRPEGAEMPAQARERPEHLTPEQKQQLRAAIREHGGPRDGRHK